MKTMHKLLIALSCCTALISTGCAVHGQDSDDFTNFNSELVTPQDYVISVRPATDDSAPKMDDLASDVAQNNSQKLDLNGFQSQADAANSCANSCRDEAATAARDCQQFAHNPEECVVESRDVFTTCFANDCKDFGMNANDEPTPEQDFSATQDAAPEMTCEQKCHTRYQDAYLVCLQSPTSNVDQCRAEAEAGIDACFNAHCVEVPELEAPAQADEIEIDVVQLCENACNTDAMDLYHECLAEEHADVSSCRAHAIEYEGSCVEQHCPKS